MFILQLLIPQEFEEDTIDVFVMVELASKIQDLLHNESCELLDTALIQSTGKDSM